VVVLAVALAFAIRAGDARAGTGAVFPPQTANSGCQYQGSEPDPSCTPGAVFNVTAAQVCVSGYSRSVRDVTEGERRSVYAEYGLSYPQPDGAYEVDHLVPLELGGSNDIANLWPQPAQPVPGFHQKDGLENYLHDQVCAGAMALADVQTAIASDWLGAWNGMQGQTIAPTTTSAAIASPAFSNVSAPASSSSSGDGHTYYASTASNASNIYCDTDSEWRRLSPRNLVSFDSLTAAMAALPGYHLHKPC
jgi:hypothetical protein